MDFSNIERYLDSFVNYEVIPGFGFAADDYDLGHVRELLRRLGDPHLGIETIHVAGSKGKGSISALIANALTACGLKTGLFTSPHLIHLGERIRVDGVCVSPEQLDSALATMQPCVDAMLAEGHWRRFTYFELISVLAVLHFRSCGVVAQVVEVGLGGRLDATNVVRPDVCVIAPISLEHTAVLGETLEEIATEKAGIIKPGAAVVCAPQSAGVMAVIEARCAASGVTPVRVGREITFNIREGSLDGQLLSIRGASGERLIRISLSGTFQAENAVTAVAALDALRCRGVALDDECIARGLATAQWSGRFQVLARNPLLVLDGAHNPASMRRLAESLVVLGVSRQPVFVLGFSNDKDVRGTVTELIPLGVRIVLTRSQQPRALEPHEIAARINDLGLEVVSEREPLAALQRARGIAGEGGNVCVAGSLYLLAEILRWWQNDPTAGIRWASSPDAMTLKKVR